MIRTAVFALAVTLAATGASAAAVIDPAGDFVATYTGPHNGDLDILSAGVSFDGTNFHLNSSLNGMIGTSSGSLYVWGINRGAGTARLTLGTPSVGQNILFDAVAVLFPNGTARAVTFPAMGAPTITPLSGAVTVTGNTISGIVPLSLLPSRGFAAEDYTFTLWSRRRVNPAMDGFASEIADFAPDASSLTASVPEPSTWLTLIVGFGLVGAAMRRRARAVVSYA
jgi:hypothetical protein